MVFPAPIPIPDEVSYARKARSRTLLYIVLLGMSLRLLIATGELIGYALFGSSALLLDGLATIADVASSIAVIVSIKLAERPPDKDHPFGHGKYEPLIGMQLGIFFVLSGTAMLIHEWMQFLHLEPKPPLERTVWLVPLVACALLEMAGRRMQHIARQEQASVLTSEAFHFRIDSLSSILALVATVAGAVVPDASWIFDAFGAMAIAIFMIGIGVYAAKTNCNQLLDRIPDNRYFATVRQAAMKTAGVLGVEKIRMQHSGPDAHVDIDVEVDPNIRVEQAHTISQQVRLSIQRAWPQVREVVVHIEPFYPNDH